MANIKPYLDEILKAVYGEEVRTSIVNALQKVNDDNESYQAIKNEILTAEAHMDSVMLDFNNRVSLAETTFTKLDSATSEGKATITALTTNITTADNLNNTLTETIRTGETVKGNIETTIGLADTSLQAMKVAKTNLDASVETAVQTKTNLDESIRLAESGKNALDGIIKIADQTKGNVETVITNANLAKSELQTIINSADTIKADLSSVIVTANSTITSLTEAEANAKTVLNQLIAENNSAKSNLEQLRSENFNSQEILTGLTDLRAYLGIASDDIIGLEVDYKNKTCKRLAGATNLTAGADFDKFNMYGGRKRCNVADDGTILAYFGDPEYKEDGSNGQVMVYQPKFYYMICPVDYEPIAETGIGYHLRKANYYVSDRPMTGFRLHPAFFDGFGNEVDYILLSAYEGSIYDTSAGAYLLEDEQKVADWSTDKFSSVAGARPSSGWSQNLTRTNIELMCKNRGQGWHSDNIKTASMNQLLMIIEFGSMNTQTALGRGVVDLSYSVDPDKSCSYAGRTGSTSELGNASGQASLTKLYVGGVESDGTTNGKTSVSYRGMENPWGNIWKFIVGMSMFGDGKMGGGQPFICKDYNYAEYKNNENYEGAGFTIANKNGYISAMGYSAKYDWLFIASETDGDSSLPVGDYTYVTTDLNAYRIALLGGRWADGSSAGGFYWYLAYGVGYYGRNVGGRSLYVPTAGTKVV